MQQSLITLANGTLLYTAPNFSSRRNMTVWTSDDDANSWQIVENVYPGPSGYSAVAERQDGVVGLAYERDVAGCDGETCCIQWTFV